MGFWDNNASMAAATFGLIDSLIHKNCFPMSLPTLFIRLFFYITDDNLRLNLLIVSCYEYVRENKQVNINLRPK